MSDNSTKLENSSDWYIPEDYISIFRMIEKILDDRLKMNKGAQILESSIIEKIADNCKYLKISPDYIVKRFIAFCIETRAPLVVEPKNGNMYYYFRFPSTKARDYKMDYANARIIVEEMARHEHETVSRIEIYEAIHKYIQHEDVTPDLSIKDRENELSFLYSDKVKRAISILKKNNIIKEAGKIKSKGKKSVATYVLSEELFDDIANESTVSQIQQQIIDKAYGILYRRMVELNTTYSITKEDEKRGLQRGLRE